MNAPRLRFACLFEELLVVIKASATSLRKIQISPHTSEGVRSSKYQENEVGQVVEHDGRQEGNTEIGNAPDDDGYGSALGSCCRWEDFGRDQPDGRQPADTESAYIQISDCLMKLIFHLTRRDKEREGAENTRYDDWDVDL